ncbi:MAG: hypothetical protein NTV46_18230 [Verrucomicrobia bacterium]|nr:hypothetical protein [Verrucomicrobiota bacterium]
MKTIVVAVDFSNATPGVLKMASECQRQRRDTAATGPQAKCRLKLPAQSCKLRV